jgi:tripeptide aminopeptidase
MLAEFVRLCEIESPSKHERAVVNDVTRELRGLGLEVREDDSGSQTGSDSGNLFARIPGPDGARTILLCAHLDTVPLVGGASVEVERTEEGVYQNRNEAILGADNKAAVAVMLEVARQAVEHGAPVGIELLFTTTEELALAGAKAFDASQFQSDFGFVFDHASPIGELIVAAPTYFRIEAHFHGQAAHAGIRPEAGHNAIVAAAAGLASIEFGRLDPETTCNVGTITGGTEGNVVAERCELLLEARSLDHDRAQTVTQGIVDALTAAATDNECDVDIDVQQLFKGYRLPRTGAAVVAAAAALETVGIEPRFVTTGGGSDANAFIADGFQCLNLANGTLRNHQPDEAVSEHALVQMLDVAMALVHASADAEPAEWGLPAEAPVPTAAATAPAEEEGVEMVDPGEVA